MYSTRHPCCRIRFRSAPVNFSHAGDGGSDANRAIRATSRRRSRSGTPSSSFAAEGLMKTLWLATAPQFPHHPFEREIRLPNPRR